MREKTCCFIGHQAFPPNTIYDIQERIGIEIERLYNQGVTDFVSGGTFGFDLLAATMIFAKQQLEKFNIRLIFVLPCRDFNSDWSARMKFTYQNLFELADDTIYVSEKYSPICVLDRDHYMVDMSAHCVCVQYSDNVYTTHSIKYAKEQGLNIIDLSETRRKSE